MSRLMLRLDLPEYDNYLAIYSFSHLEWQFQTQKD
jgi:hypothetical protein